MDSHMVLLIVAVFTQMIGPRLKPKAHCKGMLTIAMLVWFIKHVLNHAYKLFPLFFLKAFFFDPYLCFRYFVQIWPGLVLCTVLNINGLNVWDYYCVGLFVLYVDDYLTGDDDERWKRRWKALKNKLKWRWTPAPVPVSHG